MAQVAPAGEGFAGYADPDPFQELWNNPSLLEQTALYVHPRFLVVPDERPVVPNHLMVVAREFEPVEGLTFAEQQAMWALVMVTRDHMQHVLQPKRKIGVTVWNNQVRTAHIHLVPRNDPSDATVWKRMELSDTELAQQLAHTRELLAFPDDVKLRADAAVNTMLECLADVQLPPGA